MREDTEGMGDEPRVRLGSRCARQMEVLRAQVMSELMVRSLAALTARRGAFPLECRHMPAREETHQHMQRTYGGRH